MTNLWMTWDLQRIGVWPEGRRRAEKRRTWSNGVQHANRVSVWRPPTEAGSPQISEQCLMLRRAALRDDESFMIPVASCDPTGRLVIRSGVVRPSSLANDGHGTGPPVWKTSGTSVLRTAVEPRKQGQWCNAESTNCERTLARSRRPPSWTCSARGFVRACKISFEETSVD